MIGQKKLQYKLNSTTIDNFPKSLILHGESGCGKHTFCKLIEEKYSDWKFVYISNKIDYDFIESVYLMTSPTFCIIDGNRLSEKEQNVLLKLFEEPPANINIIILINVLAQLIPTVVGRAVVWSFEPYSLDELKCFSNEKNCDILLYATTPGQVNEIVENNLEDVIKLCDLIIDKISVASISNMLSLSNKFKFNNSKKNNEKGITFSLFFRVFKAVLMKRIYSDSNIKYVNAYKLVSDTFKYLNTSVNDRMLFESFLFELKFLLI